MKVVTEERLLQRLKEIYEKESLDRPYIVGKVRLLNDLIDECKEIDTLIVSKLRPIEQLPLDYFLVKIKHKAGLREAIIRFCDYPLMVEVCGNKYSLDGCEGWIPVPTYKPDQFRQISAKLEELNSK